MWCYDFVMDQTADGRRLKILPVVDESTRECLALVVTRPLTTADVVGVLTGLFTKRGRPSYVRSDNGPEFVAAAVKTWLARSGSRRWTSSRARRGRTRTASHSIAG